MCNKDFKFETHLKIHEVHSGERPFQCKICDKDFKRKDNYQKHLSVHSGENPYKCNVCDKRCSQKGELIVHMRKHHSGTRLNDK